MARSIVIVNQCNMEFIELTFDKVGVEMIGLWTRRDSWLITTLDLHKNSWTLYVTSLSSQSTQLIFSLYSEIILGSPYFNNSLAWLIIQ